MGQHLRVSHLVRSILNLWPPIGGLSFYCSQSLPMEHIATATKQTDGGLSVWTVHKVDDAYLVQGGLSNRVKILKTEEQWADFLLNFNTYGYSFVRHSPKRRFDKQEPTSTQTEIPLSSPRPLAHA